MRGDNKTWAAALCAALAALSAACSFNYSEGESTERGLPDISMTGIEYVRVKGGTPQVRLAADEGERYDSKQIMELRGYTFEQYSTGSGEVDTVGKGGLARVDLNALDVHMSESVSIQVDTEDLEIETEALDYSDSDKTMRGAEGEPVYVTKSDGTAFTGQGFSADVRKRTFSFAGGASGTYVHDDEDEDEDATGDAEFDEPVAASEDAPDDGSYEEP